MLIDFLKSFCKQVLLTFLIHQKLWNTKNAYIYAYEYKYIYAHTGGTLIEEQLL